MNFILKWLLGMDEYQYGTCCGRDARKNMRTGAVEWLLDYEERTPWTQWYTFDPSKWSNFKPYDKS